MLLAASVAWNSPLFWAVLIGWILSVVLHEFAHGLVAHLGGDYTIRERGGLTLNPLQYVDPVFSLLMPIVFLAMGGIPLPGGVTYIRTDLLRSRHWESAVSLAGPLMNLLLFVGFALPLHPAFKWVDPYDPSSWTNGQIFCGAMAVLQILAVLFNLVPVPPLDGFGAIAPYMKAEQRLKLTTPPTSTVLFMAYFFLIWTVPGFTSWMIGVMYRLLELMGFGDNQLVFGFMFRRALWDAQ